MQIIGKVTPPADLQPAIDMLGDKGRAFLAQFSTIEPWMIAAAADFERGEHGIEVSDGTEK